MTQVFNSFLEREKHMAEHTSGKASSETLERDPARDLEEIEKEEPAAAAEKEAHHGGKKKKAAKKTKGFPFGSLIFMFVLIVFIMGKTILRA